MISIESVTRTYGAYSAVDDVSLEARPGRVIGFLGPNGAGKSTTMRILVGLTPATSGTATIRGCASAELPTVSLADVVTRAWDAVLPHMDEQKIRGSIYVASDLPRVDGNAMKLERVFAHLLTNAIRFNRSQGEVFVGAAKRSRS